MIYGVDVSHWDGDIDWTKVPVDCAFAFIKASEPYYVPDVRFVRNWADCKIPKAPYHFWRYATDANTQAEQFFGVVGKYDGLPPVVDIEDSRAPKMASDAIGKIQTCLDRVEALFGRKPIIYTAGWWTNGWLPTFSTFASYQLWIADYTYNPTGPRAKYYPKGCDPTRWLFHQYSDLGVVAGIPAVVDLNVFNGTPEQFSALAGAPVPPTLEERVASLEYRVAKLERP